MKFWAVLAGVGLPAIALATQSQTDARQALTMVLDTDPYGKDIEIQPE